MTRNTAFGLFTAALACMTPFTSAYTKPVGKPAGNPIIQPGLNSLVPAGDTFSVTWKPTTPGTVTLLLLKGPSENIKPIGVIAESIPNSGLYAWTVSTDIEPSEDDEPTGYGLQLIVDSSGQYQYSTQFGISNPKYKPGDHWGSNLTESSPSSSSASTGKTTGKTSTSTGKPTSTGMGGPHSYVTSRPSNSTMTTSSHGNSTMTTHHTVHHTVHHNATHVKPTGSMTVPASLRASSSIASPARTSSATDNTKTNGASKSLATSFLGLVIAAGVAVSAL